MRNSSLYAVDVSALEKRFGSFIAVDRIDFSVRPGEIFGFLGPNGAGKSTTIKMLCGIVRPTSGSGTVGGYDIIRQQEQIRQNIGYMSQKFSLYDDLTVEENIDFFSGIYRIPEEKKKIRKDWVIRMAGLEEFKTRMTSVLSGGWKQRLALGCAIIHEPKILFLDEPTSGVDPISRQRFWQIIQSMAQSGVTVFVTTHYMDEAENCSRLALIYKGSLIAMESPQRLKAEFMKESVLQIIIPDAQEWLHQVEENPLVKEAALFGTSIHAVVDDAEKAVRSLKDFFSQKNMTLCRIERIQPSLEDVFVSLIERYDVKTGDHERTKN